jgi:hypothetical protein
MTTACPTPAKTRFATDEAAKHAAARYVKTLRTYQCDCSWWHLTSKTQAPKPIADTTVTQHVTALDDTDFELLVGAELRGHATPQQAAALRDPINHDRWIRALIATNEDIQQQLAARKNDRSTEATQWRRRTLTIQRSLRERRAEAKNLRQQAHAAAGRERALSATEGMTVGQKRSIAGERAIQRLIDAHQAEFGQYLIEEFTKDGLQVPTRIARHAARNAAQGGRTVAA